MANKKILYFTAGPIPTAEELVDIGVLNTLTSPGYSIGVRNGAESGSFGAGIESADFVAGTIPTAFNAKTNFGSIDALKPAKFDLSPNTATIAALATVQLTPLAVMGTSLDALRAHEVLSGVTYASSVPGKATVDSNGLVTGVATGSTVITGTYTYTSGKTITGSCAITVS